MFKALYIPLGLVLLAYPFSTIFLAKIYFIFVAISFFIMLNVEYMRRDKVLFSVIAHSKWFLLIHVWLLLSLLSNRGFDFYEVSGIIMPMLFVIFTHYTFQPFRHDKVTVFRWLLITAFVAMLIADAYLLVRFGNLRAADREEFEVIGSFANVNVGPMIITIVFGFLFYKQLRDVRYLIAVGLAAFIIVMSLSRNGLILLAGAFVYGFILLSSHGRRISFAKVISYIVTAVVAGVLVAIAVPSLQEKVSVTVERFDILNRIDLRGIASGGGVDRDLEDAARRIQYAAAIEVIKEKPLTGIGYGNFPDYVEAYYGVRVEVHNMFLKVWVAVGVGGVILMIFMFVQVLRRLMRRRKNLLRMGETKLAEIYSGTIVMLVFSIFQGQFRGMFGDLSFLFFLGFAYTLAWAPLVGGSRQNQRPFETASRHASYSA
jgi:O-antigen ligase